MKNLTLKILFLFAFVSIAAGATPIDVTVSDASGKVAYKGKTSGDGAFATAKLQPGNYVVQFNSQNVRGDHAIIVSAGSTKVSAQAVSASKFSGGGVAMRIEVGKGLNISAQVAAVATYIRNSWGNAASAVSASEVKKLRAAVKSGEE